MSRSFVQSLAFVASVAMPASATSQTMYEYVYPYNTADLNENHFIVLDSDGSRGWYYGTSDEFDQAREGYLPGFFVTAMSELRLSDTEISFTLNRPDRFFASPVPLEYRDASAVPSGRLEEWTIPLPVESREYTGRRSADEISLDVRGEPRVFRLSATPR